MGSGSGRPRVEFVSQYYADRPSVPAQVIVQQAIAEEDREALAQALAVRRGGPVEVRAAERGDKRRILELAERNALLALDTERLKAERSRQQRVEALDELQAALASTCCRCGSSATTSRR